MLAGTFAVRTFTGAGCGGNGGTGNLAVVLSAFILVGNVTKPEPYTSLASNGNSPLRSASSSISMMSSNSVSGKYNSSSTNKSLPFLPVFSKFSSNASIFSSNQPSHCAGFLLGWPNRPRLCRVT